MFRDATLAVSNKIKIVMTNSDNYNDPQDLLNVCWKLHAYNTAQIWKMFLWVTYVRTTWTSFVLQPSCFFWEFTHMLWTVSTFKRAREKILVGNLRGIASTCSLLSFQRVAQQRLPEGNW